MLYGKIRKDVPDVKRKFKVGSSERVSGHKRIKLNFDVLRKIELKHDKNSYYIVISVFLAIKGDSHIKRIR